MILNKKGQVSIAVLLIFLILHTTFSIYLVSSVETIKSSRFRNAADMGNLSGGSTFARGIALYSSSSLSRLILFTSFMMTRLSIIFAPDKIHPLVSLSNTFRDISGALGVMQDYITPAYLVKGLIDVKLVFDDNIRDVIDPPVYIAFPQVVIDKLLKSEEFDLNELKDPERLKEGLFGIGINHRSQFSALAKQLSNQFNTNPSFQSKIPSIELIVNKTEVEKRNESSLDLSRAKELSRLLKKWDSPEEPKPDEFRELEIFYQEKVASLNEKLKLLCRSVKEVIENIDGIKKLIKDTINKINTKIDELNEKIKYLNQSLKTIKGKYAENRRKEIESQINNLKDRIKKLHQYDEQLNNVKSYANMIIKKEEIFNVKSDTLEEDKAKELQDDIFSLYENVKQLESALTASIRLNTEFTIFAKNFYQDLNIYSQYREILLSFESMLKKSKENSSGFLAECQAYITGIIKLIKESIAKVFKDYADIFTFIESFEEFSIFKNIQKLTETKSFGEFVAVLQEIENDIETLKKLFNSIRDGTFTIVAYYSPNLVLPETYIDAVLSIPENESQKDFYEQAGYILNPEQKIDDFLNLVSEEIEKKLNESLNFASKLLDEIEKKVLETIIFGIGTGLIKATLSLGTSLIFDLVQSAIISLVGILVKEFVSGLVIEPTRKLLKELVASKIKPLLKYPIERLQQFIQQTPAIEQDIKLFLLKLMTRYFPKNNLFSSRLCIT